MKFPDIGKRPWSNIDLTICGICEILDGAVKIFSLGFKDSNHEMTYLVWRTKKMMLTKKLYK